MTSSEIIIIVAAVTFIVLVFLLLREVNCWYWKINERIFLQKETNVLLRHIAIKLGAVDEVKKDENHVKGIISFFKDKE